MLRRHGLLMLFCVVSLAFLIQTVRLSYDTYGYVLSVDEMDAAYHRASVERETLIKALQREVEAQRALIDAREEQAGIFVRRLAQCRDAT